MLKTTNLSKNLLILVNIVKKNEIMDSNRFNQTNKNLFKFQKPKISFVLSNVGDYAKIMQFSTFKASIAFT